MNIDQSFARRLTSVPGSLPHHERPDFPDQVMLKSVLSQLVILGALVAYGLIVDPDSGRRGLPCLWNLCFGFKCPGCGLSRAGALLVHGRFHEALVINWLIVPMVLAVVAKGIGQMKSVVLLMKPYTITGVSRG